MNKTINHKKLLMGALSVLVSGGLLYKLLHKMQWTEVQAAFARADHKWMLVALGLSLCLPLCNVLRWSGVLQAQALRMPFAVALRAVMMANVLNSLLPAKAGDMAKAVYLRRHANLSVGLGAVVLERLIDLLMIGVLGIAGYCWSGARWGLIGGLLLVGGVTCGFVFILALPVEKFPLPGKLKRMAAEARQVFHLWIRHPPAMLKTVAGSLLNWTLGALSVCAMISAFGIGLNWSYAFSIFPLAIMAGLLPLTLSGVGTRDTAFVYLLTHGPALVPKATATLVGVGYTVLAYWLLSLVCLPVVFWELRVFYRPNGAVRSSPGTQRKTTKTQPPTVKIIQ